MPEMKADKRVTINLNKEQLKQVKLILSKSSFKSMSAMAKWALEGYLRDNGYEWPRDDGGWGGARTPKK